MRRFMKLHLLLLKGLGKRMPGQSGGRRRLRPLALLLFAALVGVGAVAMTSFANLTGSTFEGNDGNLIVNTTGNTDWANAPKFVKGLDKPSGKGDNSFGQGTKEDDPSVTVVEGSIPPNKNDLTRFYVGSEVANGDNYLYLAWERRVNIGSANLDLEINKKKTEGFTENTTGPVTLNRSPGDLLVTYDFGGSGEPTLGLLKWVTKANGSAGDCFSANSLPCWGKRVNLSAAGDAEGAVNTGTVKDPIGPEAGRELTEGLFGEAAINLTKAGVFPAGTCEAFGSAFLKSRSSASFPAEVKDFIAPQPVNISNCGEIRIIKHTHPRGVNQNFKFTSTIPNTSTCVETKDPASFTLNDNGNKEGEDSAANTETCTNVPAGTYTVTEGEDPAGFTFNNYVCKAEGSGTKTTEGETAKQASITIAPEGVVTCVYTNDQNLGAIKITKTRKFAKEGTGTHPFEGVEFTVNGETKSTNSKGVVCFDNLPWSGTGTEYIVKEAVPTGYVVDGGNNKVVTVNNNASCSGTPYEGETLAVNNTPKTDITVSVNSQVEGGTSSTITCTDSENKTIAGPKSTGENGDGSVSATDLLPGEYTCTVNIDP
jgi:hypothetical protein